MVLLLAACVLFVVVDRALERAFVLVLVRVQAAIATSCARYHSTRQAQQLALAL